ncbi:hypothetical protein KKG45_12520 [bacterium]|nr:hypothetical protein [bacterium]MBU1074062.1 hypothetical protein [bacterium]MBU1674334.1 hypothetical protein [bacterium]
MFEMNQSSRSAAAAALALAAALSLAGCTSDEANPVGAGVPVELQMNAPTTRVLHETTARGHVALEDEDVPYDENQVLYFGSSATASSSMLIRYDFSTLPDSVPDWLTISEDNIQYARMNLYRLKFYAPDLGGGTVAEQEGYDKNYEVYNLIEPLDTSLYPGPEPDYDQLLIDATTSGANVFLNFNPATIVDWLENGHNGIIVREGPASDVAGLIGYGSMDMHGRGFQEIEREDDDTTIGPSITIAITDSLVGVDETTYFDEILVIAPVADVSTLHALETPSADLAEDVVLRTHLRLSPYFSFDLSSVPDDVFVNRAVVRLGVDFDRSYGQIQSLVVHQVPLALVDGVASVTLADLEDDGAVVDGQYAVDLEGLLLEESEWVGWDVTSTVQRIVNGVLDPDTVFLVTAGEPFTGFATTLNYAPDFYLSLYAFHGTDHPFLTPHLEITYTPFSGGAR